MELRGRVVVVTGAANGIGRVLTHRALEQGAVVVAADIDRPALEALAEPVGGLGVLLRETVDVSSRTDVERLARRALGHNSRIDAWINNAGRGRIESFLEMTDESWNAILATNLFGVFLGCQAAARAMPSGGIIVNITSALGVKGAVRAAHYAASKGAVNALSRSLAAELKPQGIAVVAVGPGQADTPLWRGMYEPAEQDARRAAGQLQDIDEFVGLVLHLAGGGAWALSGQVITRGDYVAS